MTIDPHFERDLRHKARSAPQWRTSVDGRAPRLGPRELIGDGVTRRGLFAERDPLEFPRLWTRVRFFSLAAWLGIVGGSLWKAWREHGGPPSWDETGPDED